jgi:predicted CopG family antitoxin
MAEFKLPNEKITITPLPRGSSMIKDKDHVGYFMYPNTEATTVLPRDINSGNWVKCLTEDEQKYLEKELGVNLSFSKNNKFWSNRHVHIKRTEELLRSGIVMDISNPDGYLDYKILSVQGYFAPSWEDRNAKPMEYRFAITKEGEKLDDDQREADIEQEASNKFFKMKNNKESLTDFLIRYGAKPDKDSSIEFLRTQVWKLVTKFPTKFLEIVGDSDYDTKIFLDKALRCNAIKMIGRTTYALNYGKGDTIGSTLGLAISYLKDKANSTTLLEIQARIEGEGKKTQVTKTDTE